MEKNDFDWAKQVTPCQFLPQKADGMVVVKPAAHATKLNAFEIQLAVFPLEVPDEEFHCDASLQIVTTFSRLASTAL